MGFLDELITYEKPRKDEEKEVEKEIELLVQSGLAREKAEALVRKHYVKDESKYPAKPIRGGDGFLEFIGLLVSTAFALGVFVGLFLGVLGWKPVKLRTSKRRRFSFFSLA